jgi:outer membrane receptor protein involved in Fe transport
MKHFVFAFFILISNCLFAQVTISGTIESKDKTPIEFAEIILVAKDSTYLKSEVTDDRNSFLIETEKGWCQLKIRQLDKVVFSKIFDLVSDVNLGTIIIDNSNQLQSITVIGKKKLIERKVDRLVFNIENSISGVGTDALEALKITPGVKVQNETITMIGKSKLSVMVDDKIIQLTDEDLANYLKSIPSESIKNIEVITTPPAKYEASGNSGMVNIILKKAKKNSWNALLSSTYMLRRFSTGLSSASFNYNKNKLAFSTSLSYAKGKKYLDQDDYAYFNDGLWYTSSPITNTNNRKNIKVSLDYEVTKNWTIGGQTFYNKFLKGRITTPYTVVNDYATNEIKRYLTSNATEDISPTINTVNIYNTFKLDTIGKKITVDFDYFKFNDNDKKTYVGESIIENPYSKKYFEGANDNNQEIKNLSGKIDVELPVKWGTFTFGGKISNSKTKNVISSFNSGLVVNPIPTFVLTDNKFEYDENVGAGYVSVNKKINTKWETQFGLRMEATQTKSFAETTNELVKNEYTKFFPTAYISYTANANSTVTLSYSKRIERPDFEALNPNRYFLNPFQFIEGNSLLQPSFVDNFEFTYTYKSLESKLYFSDEKNKFTQAPIADPNTKIINFTNKNFINAQRFGISENYTFQKYAWWTSNNAFDLSYVIAESLLTETARYKNGINSRISTNNDFVLNKTKTILFNASYWYLFPEVDGIYNNKAQSSLSLAMQFLMLDKSLKLSIKGADLFRKEVSSVTSVVNGIRQDGIYYYDTQALNITASYKFGNKRIKVEQRETGNEDEKGRIGN